MGKKKESHRLYQKKKNCLRNRLYSLNIQNSWNICFLHNLELKHKASSIYLDLEATCSSTSYWHLGFVHYWQHTWKREVLPHPYSSSSFPKCGYKHTCPSAHQSFVVRFFNLLRWHPIIFYPTKSSFPPDSSQFIHYFKFLGHISSTNLNP